MGINCDIEGGNIMKQITLSAFIVVALISIDATVSMAYAQSKVTIYKVTKVSSRNKLQLRAWPSPKSRVKVSLPYNAIDLVETGKKKNLGSSKWLEVSWKNNLGWVNARYLKKTGVLLHSKKRSNTNIASSSARKARNAKAVVEKSSSRNVTRKAIERSTPNVMPPQMEGVNRYNQPIQITPTEVKTAYSANKQKSKGKMLRCIGSSPQPWNIKLDVAGKKMQVKLKNGSAFNLPINYHEWASPNKVRMNIGGNKGRNIVDVNLEKTDACSTGLSRTNYMYEVNATINRDFFSGCCETVSH